MTLDGSRSRTSSKTSTGPELREEDGEEEGSEAPRGFETSRVGSRRSRGSIEGRRSIVVAHSGRDRRGWRIGGTFRLVEVISDDRSFRAPFLVGKLFGFGEVESKAIWEICLRGGGRRRRYILGRAYRMLIIETKSSRSTSRSPPLLPQSRRLQRSATILLVSAESLPS